MRYDGAIVLGTTWMGLLVCILGRIRSWIIVIGGYRILVSCHESVEIVKAVFD